MTVCQARHQLATALRRTANALSNYHEFLVGKIRRQAVDCSCAYRRTCYEGLPDSVSSLGSHHLNRIAAIDRTSFRVTADYY